MVFEWPILLLGLGLIPLFIALYLLAQRRRAAVARLFASPALLPVVIGPTPGWRRHLPPVLALLGLAALLVSLARPNAVIAVPRDQTAVMLVVDVSGSMALNDLQPSRLAAAQQAARAFVDALPAGRPVGLISFNETARVIMPLTTDRERLRRAIDRLAPGGGTALGDGVLLALDNLAQRPADAQGERAPGLVVLLADGASVFGRDPAVAGTRARGEGIPVFTVGVGQPGARPVLQDGTPAQLDEAALRALAGQTGGQYFAAGDARQLERIYAALAAQIGWVEERTEITALLAAAGALILLAGSLLSLRWFQRAL